MSAMNEEMIEATVSSFVGKTVFVYYTPANTVQVRISISGDLMELPRKSPEEGFSYYTMGMGSSVIFCAKSVEKVEKGKNLNGDDCLNIYLKTREEWQRENA